MKRKVLTVKGVLGVLIACVLLSLNTLAQLPTAKTIADQMRVGWNLGNTLEAICSETAWNGGVTTTQQLIDKVRESGFNTVRLPVAWDCHTSNGVIDAAWLNRVQQVVDYCINNNMYVVLNIHWDGGWLEKHVNTTDQASVNAKQKNYWRQIAEKFKNYDEHLLFASCNEPDASDATTMSVLLSYHQTFINEVRVTGGNNSSRTLILQGPQTDIEKTDNLFNTMPNDWISNRLMVEVHYYTPYQFCLMDQDQSWGNMFYYWGTNFHSSSDASRNATWGEESYVETAFNLMKTKFINNGIPVIIGEFAAMKRTLNAPSSQSLHDASRKYFYKYIVSSAKSKGLIPYVWDIHDGLFDRSAVTVKDQAIIDAINQGSNVNYITLRNKGTGLYADGMWRFDNGSNVGQWSESSTSNAQQWLLESAGKYVRLKNRGSGLYLDGMWRSDNGANVGQWSDSNNDAQQWLMETQGGYVTLKNRATGLYLDGMWRNTNGSDLSQWSNSGSDAQKWVVAIAASTGPSSAKVVSDVSMTAPEDSTEVQVMVSPNPFVSTFAIKVEKPDEIERIVVSNLKGVLLEAHSKPSQSYLNTLGYDLNPGVYIVQVFGKNWSKHIKVIKL